MTPKLIRQTKKEEYLFFHPFFLDCLLVCLLALSPHLVVRINTEAPFNIQRPLGVDNKSKDRIWKGNATPGEVLGAELKCCAIMEFGIQDTGFNEEGQL